MSSAKGKQVFGGPWSLVKLDLVSNYLKIYTTALTGKFELFYIDAFAGSGEFHIKSPELPLFSEPAAVQAQTGSAVRAVQCTPPFDQIRLVELKASNADRLRQAIGADPRVEIIQGDANQAVIDICVQGRPWTGRRGVVFLDPFGMNVEWETLRSISATRALDVWYLFPLFGLFRNSPKDRSSLDDSKRAAVTRILGTPDWEEQFYKTPDRGAQPSLLDLAPLQEGDKRTVDVDGLEAFAKQRLETVFPYVHTPKRLLGPGNAPLFSLFLALSNPGTKAGDLAAKFANALIGPRRR